MKALSFLFSVIVFSCSLLAQTSLPMPASIQEAYNKSTRDMSGKPGPRYWQNKSYYKLNISFEPTIRKVTGTVDILYHNNSSDTLKQLWFKLYPNLYKRGVERKTEIAEVDLGEGLTITSMWENAQPKALNSLIIEGTNMHTLIQPLAPKSNLRLTMKYSYTLNKTSSIRTGQVDAGSFFIAYFFPRIAVYDDVDGWNTYPYDGPAEFYNDHSDFEVAITVPKDYVVWATGDLTNANKVFNPLIVNRLKQAETSNKVVEVITLKELNNKSVTAANSFNIWKFTATNIPDFVFAVSNHYLMQSLSVVVDSITGSRTRVDAAYNSEHKNYQEVIDFASKTVSIMGHYYPKWPFPYSHVSVFAGLDEMEYPMMVNANPTDNRYNMIALVVHEVFHAMFPFFVGINETKYGWMDEGWATLAEWIINPQIEPTFRGGAGIDAYAKASGTSEDTPIMTTTHELEIGGHFNTYIKPALGYLHVKDYLGDSLFTQALHHYINQWKNKHPMPYDFFFSINEGAQQNLNWFWKRWFFDIGVVDMAIRSVVKEKEGYSIDIENKGRKPLPVDLSLTYADGSIQKIHKTIGVWQKDDRKITIEVKTYKILQKVEMGSIYVPDKDKTDNIYEIK